MNAIDKKMNEFNNLIHKINNNSVINKAQEDKILEDKIVKMIQYNIDTIVDKKIYQYDSYKHHHNQQVYEYHNTHTSNHPYYNS